MKERQIHLKVKVKTLAAESRIIKKEAQKTKGEVKWSLNDHRKSVVRYHARLNHLAYGLIRGVQYEAMESKCKEAPDLPKVVNIARRFGGEESQIDFWLVNAKEKLKNG